MRSFRITSGWPSGWPEPFESNNSWIMSYDKIKTSGKNAHASMQPAEQTIRTDTNFTPGQKRNGKLDEYKFYRWFRRLTAHGCVVRKNGVMFRSGGNKTGVSPLDLIPVADILQECRLAILESGQKYEFNLDDRFETEYSRDLLKLCSRRLYNLLRDYGYLKSKRYEKHLSLAVNDKGEIVHEAQERSSNLTKNEQMLVNKLLDLWESGSTAKEIAVILEITDKKSQRRIEHAFSRYFSKGLGHGGVRKNAGRNK